MAKTKTPQPSISDEELMENLSLSEIVKGELIQTLDCPRCGIEKTGLQGSSSDCLDCGCSFTFPWGKHTIDLVRPCRWCGKLPYTKDKGPEKAPLYMLYCGTHNCLDISSRGLSLDLWMQIKRWNEAGTGDE